MTQLISLIYISTAPSDLTQAVLLEILDKSRVKNKKLNITGMLLYHNHSFIQVLEGPEDAVQQLFETISMDRRHKNVMLVLQQPITEREFSGWAMSFLNIEELSAEQQESFTPYLSESFNPDNIRKNSSPAYILLRKFKELI